MADLCAKARSNYFRVIHAEEFLAWANDLKLKILTRTNDNNETLYGIASTQQGGWPSLRECPPRPGHKSPTIALVDVVEELADFLPDNEVAILFEIGWEGDSNLFGESYSITSAGCIVIEMLDDIYSHTARELEIPVESINRAED